jgi:Ca2+/H+ antiporter, TMEM165/GDT1 family
LIPVDPTIALICFPVIFVGELPDKTMFASLVMATRGRPRQVWLGAAAAFTLHVAIAVTVGVALFAVLPQRGIDAFVAALFATGAAYAWRESTRAEDDGKVREGRARSAVLTAFVVIFLAEWGDLTQILTANMAARYHAPIAVAVGALIALWAVAGLAVVSGRSLMRFVDVRTIRRVTAVLLVLLAGYTAWTALA